MIKKKTFVYSLFFLCLFVSQLFSGINNIAFVKDSIVNIKVKTARGKFGGTGFFINPQGFILTCAHVITSMNAEVDIILNSKKGVGKKYSSSKKEVEIVYIDHRMDFAIIKVHAINTPCLIMGNAKTDIMESGDVWAIGFPYGFKNAISKGVVSNLDRKINGFTYIQVNMALNPGNSGGPLISSDGEVVGLVTSKIKKADGLGFALHIDVIKEILVKRNIPFLCKLGDKHIRKSKGNLKIVTGVHNSSNANQSSTNTNRSDNQSSSMLVYILILVNIILTGAVLKKIMPSKTGIGIIPNIAEREDLSKVDIELL